MANWTPPEELRKACHISSKEQYDEMYKRSIDDPEGFWGDIANQFHWEKKVPDVLQCFVLFLTVHHVRHAEALERC